jgi:hypothetical protein
MKSLIILIHLTFFFSTSCHSVNKIVLAKKTDKQMEIIFNQKLTNFTIKFQRNNEAVLCSWEAIATNINGEEFILEKDSIQKDSGWLHQESVSESPVDLYNITTAAEHNNYIYVVYNRFGNVYAIKYDVTKKLNIIKEKRIIQKYLASGGFGEMKNRGEFKIIEDAIYLNLHVGQSFTGIKSALYRFTTPNYNIVKINFNKDITAIKTVSLDETARLLMQQMQKKMKAWEAMSEQQKKLHKDDALTQEELTNLRILEKHATDTISYFKLSADKNIRRDEETKLSNEGFQSFNIFKEDESLQNAPKYITEILEKDKPVKSSTKIKLLGYMKDSVRKEKINNGLDDTIIYFFYQDNEMGDVKIIRYDNYPMAAYWYIGNFKEEYLDKK